MLDCKFLLFFLIVIIFIFIICNSPTKEYLTNIPSKPLLYDSNTGVITDASEFIGLPDEIVPPWGPSDIPDDSMNNVMDLRHNMCSKSCCSNQYPPPFLLDHDAMVCNNNDTFVGNTYKCNNAWQNSGCVCLTDTQRDFLAKRGGNS